jgi:hypothetical protein
VEILKHFRSRIVYFMFGLCTYFP